MTEKRALAWSKKFGLLRLQPTRREQRLPLQTKGSSIKTGGDKKKDAPLLKGCCAAAHCCPGLLFKWPSKGPAAELPRSPRPKAALH